MRNTVPVTLIALCVLLLTACDPEVQRLEWTPVDRNGIQSALLRPSGHVDHLLIDEFQAFLETFKFQIVEQQMISAQVIEGLWNLSTEDLDTDDLLADLVDTDYSVPTSDPSSKPENTTEQTKRHGTSLYLRYACPGKSVDFSEQGFDQGEIRIDSTELNDFSNNTFLDGSDLFFQFLDCQTPAGVINAATAGWISDAPGPRIVMDLKPLGLEFDSVRVTAADFRANLAHLLVEVDSVGSYRLSVTVSNWGDVSLLLLARDGLLRCLYQTWGSQFIGCTVVS